MKIKLKDKWFYLPIVILLVHFIYRLIDQSQLLFYFPLDYFNDVSSYMAQLHFLRECGFLGYCSYWYNGFIAFQATPPAWFFFALPFYYLFGDVKVATYFTIILSFFLAFLVIYVAGKKFEISKVQSIAFFSFMFMTSLSVGSFIRLGRVHELFAWIWFLVFAFLVLYYRNRNFDKHSLWIMPTFSLILLSYQSVGVMASLLFLCLFIVKPNQERVYVVVYFFGSLLLSSFWLVPFLKASFVGLSIAEQSQNAWLWQFTREQIVTNLAAFLLPVLLSIFFYFYWKSNKKSRNELYFFLPLLILSALYFFRLTPFIPIFSNIFPDPYLTFFLFFTLFFFFNIDYKIFSMKLFRFVPFILLLAVILSVFINISHTPEFIVPDRQEHKDLLYLFDDFEGSFLLFGDYPTTIYPKAVYSYASIYYDLKTPFGWYPHMKEKAYFESFSRLDNYNKMNCESFDNELKYFNTTHVIGYSPACEKFYDCGFKYINKSGGFCLYSIS